MATTFMLPSVFEGFCDRGRNQDAAAAAAAGKMGYVAGCKRLLYICESGVSSAVQLDVHAALDVLAQGKRMVHEAVAT